MTEYPNRSPGVRRSPTAPGVAGLHRSRRLGWLVASGSAGVCALFGVGVAHAIPGTTSSHALVTHGTTASGGGVTVPSGGSSAAAAGSAGTTGTGTAGTTSSAGSSGSNRSTGSTGSSGESSDAADTGSPSSGIVSGGSAP